MLLTERVAVVTGAGRGIGRAVATTLVREGARVVVNDLDEAEAVETKRLCETIAERMTSVCVGDVREPRDTDRLMEHAVTRFGGLDVLVNNAGVTRDRVVHQMSDEDWDLVLDVSLRGTFNCVRSAARHMREVAKREIEAHGAPAWTRKIVNFGSTAAIRGNPGQLNYTAAKMGVVGMTRTLAQEWGRFGICVNVVAPGFIETRLTAAKRAGDVLGVPEEQRQAMRQRVPLGRFGDPEDVAKVVLFFASPLSDYVTGQELNVSGGMQIP